MIDFDCDGWPDLFCSNGAALPALLNQDPSTGIAFIETTATARSLMSPIKPGLRAGYSMGVAVGDYNNDGHEDLFVVGVHGNQFYRNNGDGTFRT